jgi:tetratricopeptide (TPR) repeat protein
MLLSGFGLSAQHIEDDLSLLDSLLSRHKNMHFYQSPTIGSADSVWHRVEHFYLYFDTDSICRQFVRKGGFNAIPDELDYLYFAVFTEMQPEQRDIELGKMEKMAKLYDSEMLRREIELHRVFLLPDNTDEQFDHRLQRYRELQRQTEIRKDTLMMIRVREHIYSALRYRYRTFEMLEEAIDIVKFLDDITDEQYAGRRHLYFTIGEMFYLYGYKEQGVELTKKALKDAKWFFERSNLRALCNLGIYSRNEGDLDMSDRYFRAMLESQDKVKYRGEYDAIAISNLGKNYLIRKDYPKAEQLLLKGLPVMAHFDPVFSTGVYINLGNCYLAQRKLPLTKAMIDSALLNVETFAPFSDHFLTDLYPLMSKYYAMTGDVEKSMAYADSTATLRANYKKQYNDTHIFNVEKKLYEAEKKVTEEQLATEKAKMEKYRNLLLAVLIITLLTGIFYFLYNRLRNRKNRILYKRYLEESRMQDELSKITLEVARTV